MSPSDSAPAYCLSRPDALGRAGLGSPSLIFYLSPRIRVIIKGYFFRQTHPCRELCLSRHLVYGPHLRVHYMPAIGVMRQCS